MATLELLGARFLTGFSGTLISTPFHALYVLTFPQTFFLAGFTWHPTLLAAFTVATLPPTLLLAGWTGNTTWVLAYVSTHK